ncbi:MAG: damage-control phosphatase ARMT1 family protein [Candidatus Thorarchaeota archaeon]
MLCDKIEVPLIPRCSACIIHSLIQLAPLLTDDPQEQIRYFAHAMSILSDGFEKRTRPHPLSVAIYTQLYEMAGVTDPYAEIKRSGIKAARNLIPEVDRIVSQYEGLSRLRAALSAAITGNLIDYTTAAHKPNLDTLLQDYYGILTAGFSPDDSAQMWQEIKAHKGHAVLIADNAGESFFDIPLIRLLRDEGWHVTYVVKGGAMANDVTREDIRGTELEELVQIADTGAKAHGVPLGLVSHEFLSLVSEADLMISKGQANVETLPEIQEQLGVAAYYVLKGKCPHIAQALGANSGENIVRRWPSNK